MRKRIQQLARGKFEYDKPTVSFSEESIEIEVYEDIDYTGSFTMKANEGQKLRGIVYSTNERMECLTPQFEGEEVRIRYRFHSKGLTEGECYKGEFVIVWSGCEFSLSFCAQISRLYPETSIGKIRNLYDFTCLAKEHWEEAYQLFYHKSFSNIIKPKEVQENMIYHGIMASKPSNQNLEEFLIGIRKKNKILFSVDETELKFQDVAENLRETIHIHKDSWGFLSIRVESDAEFLIPDKTSLIPEDFLGSSCELNCVIDGKKLHAGNNYAKLTLRSVYQEVEILFTVKNTFGWTPSEVRKQIKEYQVGIMELYQAYRLKRIVTGVWANETIEILDHLHAIEPKEPMHLLMKAQALIINRQRQEAEWILDEFKRSWEDELSPVWGYYLYLLTLMEREPAYVDRMTREIRMIFHENPGSELLFWVLLFLEERYYNNSAEKIKAIRYWVLGGCSSPYLYLEAYYLYSQDPYLLRKLGDFELQILRWAVKLKCLTKEIVGQIFSIVEMTKDFSVVIYRLLCAAYEVSPKPEYIGIICRYLIKGQQYHVRYHEWYEKGIELELRITGLYEAYLQSMDERNISHVPQIIQMYFQYESRLPYKKQAVLYNNIIASKRENPEMYMSYRKTMGRFAMEQVEQRHMDDNLAVVYTDMLDLGLISEEIAHHLSHILFTQKLYVYDPHMVRVWIYQRQLKEPQIIPIVDQVAYFQLFSKEYVILFEDSKGRRYAGGIGYQIQNLMDPAPYLKKCMELAPKEIPYIISHFDAKQNYLTFTPEDERYFLRIVTAKELSSEYKAQMIPEILQFYQMKKKDTADEIVRTFIRGIDVAELAAQTRKFLFELMVERRMYEEAYEMIREYGIDQIRAAGKVTLATHMIRKFQMEEDEFLTALTYGAFSEGKYNDVMLEYLSRYYGGPTDKMYRVWTSAKAFEADTFDLEERILAQMLYSDLLLPDMDSLFEHYYENGGREMVVLAYLTARSHRYFVQDEPTGQLVFDIIESRYLYHLELNDACKLALLRHIADLTGLTKAQYQMADELLSEFTRRNMVFAFYKRLDHRLVKKYHLYDKVILEYRTDPRKHVVLHYSRDEDGENFRAEDMTDIYDGIFVKQFVMFFGEMIQYYISEEQGTQVEVTQSSRLTNNDVYAQDDQSRYSLINQMLISATLMEGEEVSRYMRQYHRLEELTKNLFHL